MRDRKIKKETTCADEVVHSLNDFVAAVDAGEPITVRTVKLDLEPHEFTPDEIRELRTEFGASQAIFAQLLAVSKQTVQAWEQGNRKPLPTVCRLLDNIKRHPGQWKQFIRDSVEAKAANVKPKSRARRAEECST